jgi:hypothetical protein
MKLTGLHLLLTYQCNLECPHCFVWGSARHSGAMTIEQISLILDQAEALGTVEWIYFEGGEPFLYFPIMRWGVARASAAGFRVGIVSNGYWATAQGDARTWLEPLQGRIDDLSISSDSMHWGDSSAMHEAVVSAAAGALGMPVGYIRICDQVVPGVGIPQGQLPEGESSVMYRGRAARELAPAARQSESRAFDACLGEDLRDPGRVHVDRYGNLHICQGLVIGNLFERPLVEIVHRYQPDLHPVIGPLLAGGPLGLAGAYGIPVAEAYADGCQLCDETRRQLRKRFPAILGPDEMYGVFADE